MQDFTLPTVEAVRAAENYARFHIEPLEQGYGPTLGNALRRVLLSSIPGAAITKIKIDGVYHEFSTLPGVREDVTELVLNIKGIRVRSYAERPVKVQLSYYGRGVVRAANIEAPSTVEVVNPEHYIATLDDDNSRLDIELTVERHRGYLPVENRDPVPIGEIPIDAIFTPIPRVNYIVEPVRSGDDAQHERLVLEIWSDGTVKPGDALRHAAQVFGQYTETIAKFNRPEPTTEGVPQIAGVSDIPSDVYNTPIESLDLTTRTYNSLKRADITKIGQLLEMDERALMSVRNFGSKSVDEVREKLVEAGYVASSDVPPALAPALDADVPEASEG